MIFFDSTLIDPIFDVESIGDIPRVPRSHLDVVFDQTIHVYRATPVHATATYGFKFNFEHNYAHAATMRPWAMPHAASVGRKRR